MLSECVNQYDYWMFNPGSFWSSFGLSLHNSIIIAGGLLLWVTLIGKKSFYLGGVCVCIMTDENKHMSYLVEVSEEYFSE